MKLYYVCLFSMIWLLSLSAYVDSAVAPVKNTKKAKAIKEEHIKSKNKI